LKIRGGVAAVDAAPGEVDHKVGTVNLARPLTQVETIPGDSAPCRDGAAAAEDDDLVAICAESKSTAAAEPIHPNTVRSLFSVARFFDGIDR
jgi:hypothetical protein